ncbi:hypothetical protein GEMRC1_011833 [Eukaryota sp. GEM-RC1]
MPQSAQKVTGPYLGPDDPRIQGWNKNRYLILACGFLLQINIGTLYGFSIFTAPLQNMYTHWRGIPSLAYSVGVAGLGFLCPVSGRLVDKRGPRFTGFSSALFYALGHVLAGVAVFADLKHLFWIAYGVIGGMGFSLGYVTPVSSTVQWFPDLKGFAGGVALSGFGLGASLNGIVNTRILNATGPAETLIIMGLYGGICTFLTTIFICKPPPGYFPKNASEKVKNAISSERSITLGQALRTFLYWRVWLTILGTTFTGVSIISLLSPMMQDVFDMTDIQAGSYIALFSVINMLGRLLYPILSDVLAALNLSRKWLFVWLLGSQFIVTALMTPIMDQQLLPLFVIFAMLIISGMSGSLGSLPSILAEMFGSKSLASLHGMTLAAWATAGVIGSTILNAIQTHGQDTGVEDHLLYIPFFVYIPILLGICLVAAFSLRPYRFDDESVLPTSTERKSEEMQSGVSKPVSGDNEAVEEEKQDDSEAVEEEVGEGIVVDGDDQNIKDLSHSEDSSSPQEDVEEDIADSSDSSRNSVDVRGDEMIVDEDSS